MNYYYHQDAIHVSRVDLLVKDLKKSLNFYLNDLGFSILNETNEYTSLTTNYKHELIRLYEDKSIDKNNNMNIYHFALLLPSRKDLSKFLHHLIAKQIPIDGAADHLVSEAIYLRDPDDIGIEVACDKDDNYWNIKDNLIKMDSLPFDYKGVYYETDELEILTNLPVETVIGHLHLQVNDLSKAKDFYHEIIGFNITNEDIYNAVFMSDKNYHHHLALNSWSRNKKAITDHPAMKAFTLSYPTCEKYLKTINKLEKNNISYQETAEGVFVKDSENTEIYLKI
jgi:catechol 2,3-dioxygenase